jgi:WD40 repeat protein
MVTTTYPPSWYLDPTGRHELRYWDGARWTENVSDRGVPSVDALPDQPATDPQDVPFGPVQPATALSYADAPVRTPWYRRRGVVIAGAVVLVLIGLRVVSGGNDGTGSQQARTSPAPTYPGALLGLPDSTTGSYDVVEVRSGADATERGTVWGSDIAGYSKVWVSPDGTRAVSEAGTVSVLGSDPTDLNLGHLQEVSFSPDGSRIAFTPDEGGTVRILDIGTGAITDVLQTPCQSYGAFPVMTEVCGNAERALWVDGETLLVWHLAGEMPSRVDCIGPGIASDCEEPWANTYSIVSTSGAIQASVAGDRTPLALRGSTVLLPDGQWVEVAELRAGAMTPKPLPVGALTGSLSPDGTRVVVPGDPWTVVDIRTGGATPLGTAEPLESLGVACFWSPDGQFLAVQDSNDVLVVPMSATPGGWIGPTDFTLIGWAP